MSDAGWQGHKLVWHYYVRAPSGDYITLCGKHRRDSPLSPVRLMWNDSEYKCKTCYRLAPKEAAVERG